MAKTRVHATSSTSDAKPISAATPMSMPLRTSPRGADRSADGASGSSSTRGARASAAATSPTPMFPSAIQRAAATAPTLGKSQSPPSSAPAAAPMVFTK